MQFEEMLKKGMQNESLDQKFTDDLAVKMQELYESTEESSEPAESTENDILLNTVRTEKNIYLSIISAAAAMTIIVGSILAAHRLKNNDSNEADTIAVTEAVTTALSLSSSDNAAEITAPLTDVSHKTGTAASAQTVLIPSVPDINGSEVLSSEIQNKTNVTIPAVQNTSLSSQSSALHHDVKPENADEKNGVRSDFESHDSSQWEIKNEYTANSEMELNGGKCCIRIINPGGSSNGGKNERDILFRTGGISMKAGHRYSVSYEITADHDGYFRTVIKGKNKGNSNIQEVWSNTYGKTVRITEKNGKEETESWNNLFSSDNWSSIYIQAGQTFRMNSVFTCDYDIENSSWEFELGGSASKGIFNHFPEGSEIIFDNMIITDEGEDDSWDSESPSYLTEDTGTVLPDQNEYEPLSPAPLFASVINNQSRPGETVSVSISVNSEEAVHYLAMDLNYDRDALELISASLGDEINADPENLKLTVSKDGSSDLIVFENGSDNTAFMSRNAVILQFRIKETASEQKYIIQLSENYEHAGSAFKNENGNEIFVPAAFASGSLTVRRT